MLLVGSPAKLDKGIGANAVYKYNLKNLPYTVIIIINDKTVTTNPPINVTAHNGIDSKKPQDSIAVIIELGKVLFELKVILAVDIIFAVIMKAPSSAVRFTEASKLLDYGFSTYTYKQFANAGDVLKNVEINKGVNSSLNLVYEENTGTLIKKGEDKNIDEILTIENNISAPISKWQRLGQIPYNLNGSTISSVNLVAQNDIKKIGVLSFPKKVLLTWLRLLR